MHARVPVFVRARQDRWNGLDGRIPIMGSSRPVVIMGVSGSGKSTIGRRLAERLGVPFLDGDDLHPAANKLAMAAGQPLTDADRAPWLDAVGAALRAGPGVVACSALRRRYRDTLRSHAPSVVFVHLDGSRDVLESRLAARQHEFMSPALLDSQLQTLEAPGSDEDAVVVSVEPPADEVVDAIVAALAAG